MEEMLSPRHMSLLTGRLSRDEIPSVKAHVIRVYLCSAGTDSQTERDAFVESVYPRLRDYCRDRYGLEFQVVDLAWGLPADTIDSQPDLTPLRIREIQRCHALSAGPNFIAFIGQKYGPASLPDVILAEEYDAIRLALHSHKARDTRNAPMLDESYIIDDNNIPPVYVLKDKTVLVPEFKDENEEIRQNAQNKWEEIQTEIRTLLQKGASLAYTDGSIDSETKERYFLSELENQIMLGVETNDSPSRRCVLLTRDITDLKNYVDDARTARFAEVCYSERDDHFGLDSNSASMLQRLKNRIHNFVSDRNTISHSVLWRYDDVISPELHRDYLTSMCDQLYVTCARLVDESAPLPETNDVPMIVDEATQHWARCKFMASHFYSESTALGALREYVKGPSETPLVLYGRPGAGKSKLVSKMAYDMEDVLSEDYLVILRYIGYTPRSRDAKHLLHSLCVQITLATGGDEEHVPVELKDLDKYFSEMLFSTPPYCRLIIILDGLDLLPTSSQGEHLSWIPSKLPAHVKLLFTVHHSSNSLLSHLREEVLHNEECFLEIDPVTVDECEKLLIRLLASIDRSLTPVQMKAFRVALESEPLPLYVELLANIAKDMNSFTDPDTLQLPKNCEEGIVALLQKLEDKHGKVFVSRAFGYMVTSSTGLSDCEMEDILSLDEDVLNEIFRDYHPPVRRIPYIKWLLLKQDVEAFLTYQDADGVTVSVWHHDSFVSAVTQRYLQDADTVTQIHHVIADYFMGTWAGRPKPVAVLPGKRSTVASFNSDRKVLHQPLTFGGQNGEPVRFNKRKYDQVPRHLDLSGRLKELNVLVFFNYDWLYTKMKALSLHHILADFALNPSEEASLVEEALRVSEHIIERDINCLPTEISGHLLPYYASHPNIRSLIRQCDVDGLKHCALVPNFPYLQVPGTSLQYTLETPVEAEHFIFSDEEKLLLCKKKDDAYVYVFNLISGDLKSSIFTSNGELHVTPDGRHFVVVDHVTEKSIKIHDAESGAFMKQIILMNHIEGKSSLYKKGPLDVTNDRLCTVVTLTNSVLCVCDIPCGNVLNIVALEGKGDVCKITPDGKQVFCNTNSFLAAYDLYSMEHILTVPIGCRPNNLVFTHDGLRAFLSNDKDTRVTIMHLSKTSIDMTYRAVLEDKMPCDAILSLSVSPNDVLLLVRGAKHILVHHRGLEKVIAKFTKPPEVPQEFRLPKAHYVQMTFTHAQFSSDSNFVVATMFRNVYVWQISTGALISSIQAPIGLISSLLVSSKRSQVVTHINGSKDIQIWNISEAVRKLNTPDKLTDAVTEIQMSSDNTVAYVKCRDSDELGVIDMVSGAMLDLMTHERPLRDFAVTPAGDWVLVCTEPRLKGTAFKLWNMKERRVVLEVGNTTGHCVNMHSSPCIAMVAQKDNSYRAPYYISVLHFVDGEFYEHAYTQTVTTVRAKPFMTSDDQFLVISSLTELKESEDGKNEPQRPAIYTLNAAQGMKMNVFDAKEMKFEEHLQDILDVRPCYNSQKRSTIAAVFSCKSLESDPRDGDGPARASPGPRGFFLLDAVTGSLTLLCIPFLQYSPSHGTAVFSRDCTLCLDAQSNIFHTSRGEYVGCVGGPGVPPCSFALGARVVLYCSHSMLYAIRLSDGHVLARCEVHAPICHLHVCSDERTILVGCEDGAVLSYTLIDPSVDNPTIVLSSLGSRRVGNPEQFDRPLSRSWDKVEENGAPGYSRPPSSVNSSSQDKLLLRQIQAAPRDRPRSDTLVAAVQQSQACVVM